MPSTDEPAHPAPRAPAPRSPIGPADREHFLDAQRRNRRASWRASLFAPIAVALAGVPLCAIVTPALYVPLLAAGYVLHGVGLLPDDVWRWLREAAHLLPAAWEAVRGDGTVSWKLSLLLMVVPGSVVMLAAWLVIRLALRRAWSGRALHGLHARRPELSRPVERRLVNSVEEVAVAAAVHPPRVLVAEVPTANAIMLGLGPDDATLVVTRGLLQRLRRDELQAVAAWGVASAGNGDLRIAATLMSVFHAWGMLGLLTDAPFTRGTRADFRFVMRTLTRGAYDTVRRRPPDRAARAAHRRAADLLLSRAGTEGGAFASDAVIGADLDRHPIFYGCLVQLPLLLTLGIASIALRITLELGAALVLGPVMAWLWRARRHLADATAVEITRHPAALAVAVQRLAGPPGVTPEAAAFSFLCFVRATRTPQSIHDQPDAPYVTNLPVGMIPDPEERLARLHSLGGAALPLADAARTPASGPGEWRKVLLWGIVAIGLAAFLMLLNFASTAAMLLGAWTALTFVFVTVPGWLAAILVPLLGA